MKRLFAAAAMAPLAFAATSALADTEVSTATTTPLVTSTAGNVTVTEAGSILVNSGVGVTVDSNSTVTSTGAIIVRDAPTATAILVDVPVGGRASTITMNGVVSADDTKTNTDTDLDGDQDGPFTEAGTSRYALRLSGPGVFTGNITQSATSTIGMKGVDGSAGVLIESGLTGNLMIGGNLFAVGDNSYGLRVTGPVTGNIGISGLISLQGQGAVGVAIDGPVTGQLKIDGSVTSSGFRSINRPSTAEARAKLDADDLLIGGPAVRVRNSISNGILLYASPGDSDTADTDEDDDGILDSEQTKTGSVRQYGSSAAILIGDTANITLGNVGTGSLGTFGVAIRGQVSSEGIYDGVSALGMQIGGLGGAVNTSGGVLVRGAVSATAYLANSTALRLGSDAQVPNLKIDGTVSAASNSNSTVTPTARGIQIDVGANVPTLTNGGVITSSVTGSSGDAVALVDASGTLTSITNNGVISAALAPGADAVAPTGSAIALDLRANTGGVHLVQKALSTDAVPAISGKILLGSGSDTFDLEGGAVFGDLSFGDGADVFNLAGQSIFSGALSKGAGTLAVDVSSGIIGMTNTTTVNLSSLNVGGGGALLFVANPNASDPAQRLGRFNVSGAATLQSGAKLSLTFASKLSGPQSFTVIQAASLTNLGADTSLLGDLPFVYSANLATTSTTATINVDRKTAAQLGLSGGRAAAFEAFYSTFDGEAAVLNAVFAQKNQAGFDNLYNQFLPDYSGGVFQSLALTARGVMQAQAENAEGMPTDEPRSWLQEVGVGISQDSPTELVYRTNGFGLAGGYEVPFGAQGGVVGVSAAFMTSDVRNQGRSIDTLLDVNSFLVGGYWRDSMGGVKVDASLNVGYAWIDSDRQVIAADASGQRTLDRTASADWSGLMASGRFGAAYDYRLGDFYIRPDASLDYTFLSESGYTETGGGTAINLEVDSRSSYQAAAEAGVTFGAQFGRTFRWGPELRVGYRTVLAGGISDTTARFIATPGQSFTLSSIAQDDGRFIFRVALRGAGAYSNIALEAGGEIGDLYRAYIARLSVRFLF